MQLGKLKDYFITELSGVYPKEEIQSFFTILLDYFLNYTRLDAVTKATEKLPERRVKDFQEAIARLKMEEPIQYITGETEFYGLPFAVNEHTLIPRPETEELVDWVLEEISERGKVQLLDIGTGTGCIAISLAKNLKDAEVSAIDISSGALLVAKANAQRNTVAVEFMELDVLMDPMPKVGFDAVVSNPPYVRELEKAQMKRNVLQYEPGSALFVSDNDPLIFYRKIARLAKDSLKPNGFLFFEINEYLGEELTKMLSNEGFTNIVIRKDMFGKDRLIKCTPYGPTK
ncbi:MAG: peptide chain release factor N(5)-glutamine methyltransferase [Aureisphaera sp.]